MRSQYDGIEQIPYQPTKEYPTVALIKEGCKECGWNPCRCEHLGKRPTTLSDVIVATGRHDLAAEIEDMVERPNHYKMVIKGVDMDAMDVIRYILGEEGWKAYCKGNMLKYLLRNKWNEDEDVAKCGRYSEMYRDPDSISR